MKKFIFIFPLLLSAFISNAQITFQKTFGGIGNDFSHSVKQTLDGGYIVAGETNSFGAGDYDVYLTKTDSSGNIVWSKTFGGTAMDYAKSVAQTFDGGYIVVGRTASYSVSNYYDIFLIKTDSSGNALWTKTYGGPDFNDGEFIIQSTDSGYVITGEISTAMSVAVGLYLLKVDVNGNLLWVKTYEGVTGYSLLQTTDGGYAIIGMVNNFNGSIGDDIFLVKTDSSGNLLWSKIYGVSNYERNYSIQQALDGGFYLAGYTLKNNTEVSYLIRTDSVGGLLWSKTYDMGRNAARSIKKTIDNGFIICGITDQYINGSIFLLKIDSIGNTTWSHVYAGSFSWPTVQQTSDGAFIIAGDGGNNDIQLIKTDSIGPYTGMWFGGDCDVSNNIAGNEMRECVMGLYLNSASRTGPQIHRGNIWHNPQTGNTTAINQNTVNFGYLNSIITYNPNSGTAYYPNTIIPPLWFDADPSGTTFNGCGTQICIPSLAVGGGDDEHLKSVARDSAISYDYRDENLNQAQSNLYALLKEDSLLRVSDSIFQNFYGNKQTLAIGRLQEVKDDLKNAEDYTPQQLSTQQLADSLMQLKTDSIAMLDSLNSISPVTSYVTLRQNIIAGINLLNNTVTLLQQQHEINSGILRDAAQLKNNTIVPVELPETNHKIVNEIVMQYKGNGVTSVTANYSTLLAIAQQCPYAGGPAVYQARAMIEMVDQTVEYFDDLICLQSGIYRIMQSAVMETPALFDFKLIPNPASQQVTIELVFTNDETVNVEIRNALGGKIKELSIDNGIKSVVFSVNNFEQGIYFVRVRKDRLTMNAKRLVIIK